MTPSEAEKLMPLISRVRYIDTGEAGMVKAIMFPHYGDARLVVDWDAGFERGVPFSKLDEIEEV